MAKQRHPIAPRKPKPVAADVAARFVGSGKASSVPNAQTSKSVVTRNDGRELRRITVYLPVELARELMSYCGKQDRQISDVMCEMVNNLVGDARGT